MNYEKEILLVIYKAINLFNNKVYIGKTVKGLEGRKKSHKNDFLVYRGNYSVFYNALKKYGWENFSWEVIDIANTEEELNQKEIYWIRFYNSTDDNYGYNISTGGSGGDNFTYNPRKEEIREGYRKRTIYTEERREKSRTQQIRFWESLTVDERRFIREKIQSGIIKYYKNNISKNKDVPKPQEVKDKIRNTLTGKFVGELNPNWGNYWTEDMKKNQSIKAIERDTHGERNPNAIKRKVFNISTNQIEEYECLVDFVEKYSIKYETALSSSKEQKVIAKNFIVIPNNIVDVDQFIIQVKVKSRWYKLGIFK